MKSQASKSNPLKIGAFALLVAGSSFGMLYAMSNLQTDATLALAAVSGAVPYDLEPDGTAVYRFGRGGSYTITCDGAKPVDWNLPASRTADDVDHVCAAIEKQRAEAS